MAATNPRCSLFKSDQASNSGGDYYNTNYPQPTYVSSRRYALHVDTPAYSAFDFSHEDFHEIEVWEIPGQIEIWEAPHFVDLVETLSLRFGRQPPLPEWVMRGAIVGLKDGEESYASGSRRSWPRARPFPVCGARIGWAFARPHSASACSGTGNGMPSAIPGSTRKSAAGLRAASDSWAT